MVVSFGLTTYGSLVGDRKAAKAGAPALDLAATKREFQRLLKLVHAQGAA